MFAASTLLSFCSGAWANASPSAKSGNLSEIQAARVVSKFAGRPFDSFADFVFAIYDTGRSYLSNDQLNAMAKFVAQEPLSGPEREVMFRVLGIYAQLKYGGEALEMLSELIEAGAQDDSAVPQSRSHNAALALSLESWAEKFGLTFQKLGGRLFEISIASTAPSKKTALRNIKKRSQELPDHKSLRFYTRAEFKTAPKSEWVLPNRKRLNPYALSRFDGKLYGLGVRNSKNAVVIALLALRVLAEERLSLHNDLAVLVDLRSSETERFDSCALDDGYCISLFEPETHQLSGRATQAEQHSAWFNALSTIINESRGMSANSSAGSPKSYSPLIVQAQNVVTISLSAGSNNLRVDQDMPDDGKLEAKSLDEFLLNLQILTEIMVRLGQTTAFE